MVFFGVWVTVCSLKDVEAVDQCTVCTCLKFYQIKEAADWGNYE